MQPLFRVQPAYDLPRLKLLPLREQPAYRVAANSDSCNLPELLAALIGGPQQIEIAEVKGIGCPTKSVGKQTAVRLKAALALARKALQETETERPIIHNLAKQTEELQGDPELDEKGG